VLLTPSIWCPHEGWPTDRSAYLFGIGISISISITR